MIFFHFSSRPPKNKFTMETEINKVIPFLDVLIDNHYNILYATTIALFWFTT